MKPSWTHKLGENIISIAKKEKRVVIQNSLSPEKNLNIIVGDTFMMLRIIWMAFHFLYKNI